MAHSIEYGLISCGMIFSEHRISTDSSCAIKCGFRHAPEGKVSDCITPYLNHGFSRGT